MVILGSKRCRGRGGGGSVYGDFAPPCTRSCEGLGPKAPKNTLFRGLSTPPTPRHPPLSPGENHPSSGVLLCRGPPRHREEPEVGWCGVVRSVQKCETR